MTDGLLELISVAVQKGKAKDIKVLVQQAIDEGVAAESILNDGLMAGMNIIGGKFKRDEVFVPEVLVAGRAMNTGTAMLKPLLVNSTRENKGKVLIGTVKGDMHDIGKNLVAMVAEGGGYEVIDLGIDVPTEKFLDAAAEKPDAVVGLSALLTTTMTNMAETVRAMKAKNPATRIMVGGAPVTEHFAHDIGADCYSADPQGAVDYLNRVMA